MEDDLHGRHPQWKMTSSARNSSYEQNLFSNDFRFTIVELKPIWNILKRMKTTSMEDNFHGR
jgi:hypothetical protein